LAADGHEVILLSRNPARHKLLPFGAQVEQWDGKTAQGWGHLVDGAGAIINLAGESIAAGRWTDEQKRHLIKSRLNAGEAVVEAIKVASNKPGVLIQSSAVGYYGPHGDEELAEDAPAGGDWLARQVAVPWENSTAAVEDWGVRRIVIRTGVVLDAKGGALPRMLLPFKFFIGGPLGGGRQWFPWIHLADEVAAIRFLIDKPQARGAYNLTAPRPLTNAAFGRVLGKVMGRPAFMPTPGFALKLLFGEMSTVLLDGQRAVPRRLLEAGFAFQFPDAESALRDILAR
jgi:hypothetical protein